MEATQMNPYMIKITDSDSFNEMAQLCSGHMVKAARTICPRELDLHPEVVSQIWEKFGKAQVDIFAYA